ncbi:MAG: hypothetical protein JXR86_05220 [Spirochaetales bacterium]|nr:hypothetical protein [Spirochaetales bacterium]
MMRTISCLLLLLSTAFLYGEVDRELAALYTDEAFYFYERDNFDLADEYVARAMEFSSDLPEAWYLAGLLREEQGDRLKSISLYRRSIDLTEVYTDYYYDLYSRYLNLINITSSYAAVLSFFEEKREIFEKDQQILLKVSDAAFRSGLIDYSCTLAGEVYMKNPYSLKALLFLMRSDMRNDYREKLRMALHRINSETGDEVIFQNLILNSSDTGRNELLELYRDIFGETAFFLLESGRGSDDEAINKSRNLMIRSYGRDNLTDGVYFGDYNFDGVSDEIVTVSGSLITYLSDPDQDNITDLSVKFDSGQPVNIYINKDGAGFEFSYSDYPYLDTVDLYRDNLRRTFRIYPGTEYTPITELDDFSWKYNEERSLSIYGSALEEPDLIEMSYLMSEYFPGSADIYREYSFRNGELTGIREDSRGDGTFSYFLDISAWLPRTGRKDLNKDDIVDIFEYYDDGKLSGIALDWNNNGKPEYIEDWSILQVRSWDFNEDFIPDAQYIQSSEGKVLYSFPGKEDSITQNDLYSWDFSFENFWFSNN